jgi:hypothetical protein
MEYKKSDLENDLSLTPDKVSGTINQDFQPEIGNKTMNMNTELMRVQPSNKVYDQLSSPVQNNALEEEALKLVKMLTAELQRNLKLENPPAPSQDVEESNQFKPK